MLSVFIFILYSITIDTREFNQTTDIPFANITFNGTSDVNITDIPFVDNCTFILDVTECLENCCALCNRSCMSVDRSTACSSPDLFIYPWEIVTTDCYPFHVKAFLWVVAVLGVIMGLGVIIYCLRHYKENDMDDEDENHPHII